MAKRAKTVREWWVWVDGGRVRRAETPGWAQWEARLALDHWDGKSDLCININVTDIERGEEVK